MSILIKGMEMPLSCETCEYKLCVWLMYQKDQVDEIIREYQARSYGLSRKDDCPYIEVPDVHGTNADRIRAMSDEELAAWINEWFDCGNCVEFFGNVPCSRDKDCIKVWLEWLKEEVTHEQNNI